MSACSLCKHIPEKLKVETMHTPDRLPKEVEKLEIIGGMCSDYMLGEVRVCPDCGTHYLYYRDHDSEGVGDGYTDESIERVSAMQAKEAMEKNIKVLEQLIQSKRAGLEISRLAAVRDLTKERIKVDEQELARLREHLARIS
jgi:hypothetical protein